MVKHVVVFLVAFIFLATLAPNKIYALQKTSGSSASLVDTSNDTSFQLKVDNRAEILHSYLEKYNSPLAKHSQYFIETADKYNLDWKLVPSIAGVESYYGQFIPSYSYNGWGYGIYNNNIRRFNSWEEGIDTVAKALREDYIDKNGAHNVYQIGALYAEDTLWASKVTYFMQEIESYGQQNNTTLPISL